MMKLLLGLVVLVLVLWSVYGYVAIRGVEEPSYTVREVRDGYEIREYGAHIVAETRVRDAEYRSALNEGFRAIADYIFGNNTTDSAIAMTVPVGEAKGEPIAMTVPVGEVKAGDDRIISFVMPSQYTLADIPKPRNPDVVLREIPPRTLAVLRFSWSTSPRTVEKRKEDLKALLSRDGLEALSQPEAAFYNPPWTPPFMLRSEVMIEVK